MDWTAVFEESGDEDFLIHRQLTAIPQAPRLARLVSKLYHHHHHHQDENYEQDDAAQHVVEDVSDYRLFQLSSRSSMDSLPIVDDDTNHSGYTLRALYYLSINYILGVGCLGIPYAFARAGFLLCSSILCIVTFSSFVTVMWVAETGERYRAHCQRQQQPTAQPQSEASPLIMPRKNSADKRQSHQDRLHPDWDRYEVVDLVQHYLGPGHRILYQISLMALMYIGLLAYSQVFCNAVSEILWGPTVVPTLGLPQLVFGVMVVPLSCVELDEQISVQSFMAGVRFLAIFIMVFGSVLALFLDDSNTAHPGEGHGPPHFAPSEPDGCQMSYTYCVSGFGVAFSTSLFSQLFQHSVPGLLRPLRNQSSKHSQVPITLGASLLTTLSFYLLLGTSAASLFGARTRSSVNLNFANFTVGLDAANTPFWLLACVKAAANIVVIFPALDTISVFPLIANTLGNNLYSAAVGPSAIKWCAHSLHRLESAWHSAQTNGLETGRSNERWRANRPTFCELPPEERKDWIARASRVTTVFWRLVAARPPLLGSLMAADLSFSLLLAGVAGVYVAFFAPSLMQLKSIGAARDFSQDDPLAPNIFQGWYSSTCLCYPVLAFATFSLAAVLAQIKGAWLEIHN